jgi:hypothetical protein
LALHGSPPDYYYEVIDLPPGCGFPQACAADLAKARALVMMAGCDKPWALAHKLRGGAERQHPGRFYGGRIAIPTIAIDIRDMSKGRPAAEPFANKVFETRRNAASRPF